MKYIIWHNELERKFGFGTETEFIKTKEKYGKQIILKKVVPKNIPRSVIQQATSLLNRNQKDS
jgi:uncharacterized protein (UPF0147 family)